MNKSNVRWPRPITTVVTHWEPHQDEVCAHALLRVFGQKFFPGIETSKVEFVDAGAQVYKGKNSWQCLQEGVLMLGIGAGLLDEHPSEDVEREEDQCCVTLALDLLGIKRTDILVRDLVEIVINNDLEGAGQKFDFASNMRALYNCGRSSREVFTIFSDIMTAHFQNARDFQRLSISAIKKAPSRTVTLNGKTVRIAWIKSDDRQIAKAARWRRDIDILVVETSNGNCQVLVQKKELAPAMKFVAATLRMAELRRKGIRVSPSEAWLYQEPRTKQVPQWHYQEKTGHCFNGSLSTRDIPYTRLNLTQVVEYVVMGLDLANKAEVVAGVEQLLKVA